MNGRFGIGENSNYLFNISLGLFNPFSLTHYNRVFSREHKNNNIKSEWFRLYKRDVR